MHSRSDHYRRRAIEARLLAAQAKGGDPKAAFEEIAENWTALADQADWIERQWPATQRGHKH